jgi:endonuclease/exonuclease/phosphatase family metal-dependent hydrolase
MRADSEQIGLSVRERRRQLALIVRHLRADSVQAAIVMGDFNEWRRVGAATRALCPPFELAAGKASFPARLPLFALDRIWCRAPLEPIRAAVAIEYRKLSDHLPVIASLEWARHGHGTSAARAAPAFR